MWENEEPRHPRGLTGLLTSTTPAAARRLRATSTATEELRPEYSKMNPPVQPLVSYAALERVLSTERLAAYAVADDAGECDTLARYIWDLALAAAIQPALHVLEIAFRNDLARAARKLTAARGFRVADIPSWLDAEPTMLMEHEQQKVVNAKERLGTDPRRRTESRLIAKLDFGFWIALCRDSYSDSRGAGPRLWPRALDLAFQRRPPSVTARTQIFHQFDRIRKFRNRVAHHEPIWDRDYLAQHQYILESLGWISPKVADALRQTSPAPAVFEAGPSAYMSYAHKLLGPPTSPRQQFGEADKGARHDLFG